VTSSSWDTEQLLQGEQKVKAVQEMFDAVAPRYDLVNRIMTFRLDTRWRRTAIRSLQLPPGAVVADLASGTGDLCIDLIRAGYKPLSFDFSFGMLSADRSGVPRAQADILQLPLADGSVDGATCGFALRNLRELPAFFDELARVVRPGGRIALLDVGVPRNRLIRAGNNVYFGRWCRESVQCSAMARPTATCRRASPTYLLRPRWSLTYARQVSTTPAIGC
jgi:demethylmenaquinone methyltransferase/2-methoxy-6-polyprenyl-1,4-benzoquinol methylase